MFRKVVLTLFGFMLFLMAGECFANASGKLKKAKLDVISLIKKGDYIKAQVQTEELIADFDGNPDLPKVIYRIAEGYRWSTISAKDKYEYAKIFYQKVIQDYPDSAYAAKAALGISRGKVLSLIVSKDFDAAGQALDEMAVEFASCPNLPDELYWIGRGFGYWEQHKQEKDAYQRILQDYPDSQYADRARLGFAKANVQSLIMLQDYDGAKKALNKLTADFSKHPDLHEALYWIAERYAWEDKYEWAKSIHRRIIQDYPESSSVNNAKLGYAKANVLSLMVSADYEGGEGSFDKMITDFSGNPELPRAVLAIGEQCYKQGLSKEYDAPARARELQEEAVKVWDRLIDEMPDYALLPEACCWAGDCYLKLGKHFDSLRCFQKVVEDYPEYEHAWHAQYTIGRCYEELKNTGNIEKSVADAEIEAAYGQLLKKYPGCPAAELAHQRLSYKAGAGKEK